MSTRHDASNRADAVRFFFEEKAITAREGETVATAVLSAGACYTGTSSVVGRDRGPYCLMGLCFECLMEIDGVPNQRACMAPAKDGMIVRRQIGRRQLQPEGANG